MELLRVKLLVWISALFSPVQQKIASFSTSSQAFYLPWKKKCSWTQKGPCKLAWCSQPAISRCVWSVNGCSLLLMEGIKSYPLAPEGSGKVRSKFCWLNFAFLQITGQAKYQCDTQSPRWAEVVPNKKQAGKSGHEEFCLWVTGSDDGVLTWFSPKASFASVLCS